MKYQLVIINKETREVVQFFEPSHSLRMIEKTQRGVHINLNHELYHTDIIPYKENENNNQGVFEQ